MNPRLILNFILLLVIVTLVLIAYFQPGVEKPVASVPLLIIAPADINRIGIMPAAKQGIIFEKEGADWRIIDPINARANKFRIESMLQLARTSIHKQYNVTQSDLEKFKLAEPLGVIQLNGIKIAFGDSESINSRRYVMIDGKVYLITDNYFHYLHIDLASYIDTLLLPPQSRIVAIELPDLTIKAADADRWSVSPEHPELPADAVQILLDEWRDVQALRVSRYQGDKAQGKIRITLDNQSTPLDFQILAREPEFILGHEDTGMRYHFSDGQARRLMQLSIENQQPQDDAPIE